MPSPLLMSVPCIIHVLTLHRNSFLRKSSVLSEWTLCEEERGGCRNEGGRQAEVIQNRKSGVRDAGPGGKVDRLICFMWSW